MKLVRNFLLGVVMAVGTAYGIFTLFPGGVVQERHETYAAAKEKGLFARGWLPDAIPESAVNITAANNLDMNVSSGEFSFSPSDLDTFLQRLSAVAYNAEALSPKHKSLLADGYAPYEFIQNGRRWIFFVHSAKAHAWYELEPGRVGTGN